MTRSAQIPQFGLYKEIDLTKLKRVRSELLPEQRFSYSDAITAASAHALRIHPAVNASFDDDEQQIVEHSSINVGLAVSGETGLIVAVIRNADRLILTELGRERDRLTKAAQEGTLSANDLFGATFVISNLGPAGVDQFQALLFPPLIAILAVGALRETENDESATATITLCLTLDHRALDGLDGAAFLGTVASMLEDPPLLTGSKAETRQQEASWT